MTTPGDLAQLRPLLLPTPRQLDTRPGLLTTEGGLEIAGDDALCAIAKTHLGGLLPCRRSHADAHATPGEPRAGAGRGLPLLLALHEPDGPRRPAGGQGYELELLGAQIAVPAHIRLSAESAAGIRHGLCTLAQLVTQYRTRLPGLLIRDEPDFATRGVMLDVSRDRVPTMGQLRELIARLASWKINHLQFYTEHTFAYAGHEEVWADASPITPADIRELDHWCALHGIQLSANQNCFGHLASWLKHPRYAPLAEIAAGEQWDFAGLVTRTGPFSLCPGDPRSLALVEDLLGQLVPNFASPLVNIGCDETFDIGQGRSREAVRSQGRAAVYLAFVRRICAVVATLGRRPQFWADIALEHPEALGEMPADLIGLAWGYEADSPFARWCDQLRTAGREAWVCPGTSCWRSITGRTRERQGNMQAAASQGKAHGASGYLVTAWGDLGHRQQWPITLHGLAEGAQRAWNASAALAGPAASLHAFADRSLELCSWLDAFGSIDAQLRAIGGKPTATGAATPLRNATALFTDLHKPLTERWIADAGSWLRVRERLEALGPAPASGDALIDAECAHSLEVARLAIARALLRRGAPQEVPPLLAAARALIPEYRRLWAARSRPGGLARSVAHYQVIADELEQA